MQNLQSLKTAANRVFSKVGFDTTENEPFGFSWRGFLSGGTRRHLEKQQGPKQEETTKVDRIKVPEARRPDRADRPSHFSVPFLL